VADVDVAIVGQGFAGTALAWQLRWRGAAVLVADRGDPDAASRVAAGLLTPVTGKRLAPTPGFAELVAEAAAFYGRVEVETGGRFFHRCGAVRLFAGPDERAAYLRKFGGGADLDPPAGGFVAPFGGFAMPAAARLAAEPYLLASRRHLGVLTGAVDPVRGVEPTRAAVRLPGLGVTAGAVVFCLGPAAVPGFPAVRADAGEVLTVRADGLGEMRTVHRGAWLAAAGGGRFLVGATYARGVADARPTAAGRADLLARLAAFLPAPVGVIAHRAGVRPVAADNRPVVASRPGEPRVWAFTGLGSKGALTAPSVAGRLADRLLAVVRGPSD
jgi:glycine/D-amino acid oxidase-like deaminating enzyme